MHETLPSARSAATTLWMEQAQRTDPAQSLLSRVDVDVCVVGGGYTGLWTAIAVKERQPELDVCIVEARRCGAGASGANGGFAMTWWSKFGTLRKLFGESDALHVARLSQQVLRSFEGFLNENAVDADLRSSGWLWAATSPSQVGSWDATLQQLAAVEEAPYAVLAVDEVERMTGSAQHLGGVFESGVATVHPGKLVEGLRQVAVARGVRIYEGTQMLHLEPAGTSTKVVTRSGHVRARSVVLSTNTALAALSQVRRHLVVVGSDVVATAPCGPLLAGTALANGLAVSDSRRLVHYYRATDDARMVFGKGGGGLTFRSRADGSSSGPNERHDAVVNHMHRVMPALRAVPVTHRWSGTVDYSVDGLPFAGRLAGRPGVCYMSGFSGNGVAPAYLAGQVLASMALESDDQWSRLPLIRRPRGVLPPEPFRFLGGNAVRLAMTRKERVEDRGGKVDLATALVTRLDPTSFVG